MTQGLYSSDGLFMYGREDYNKYRKEDFGEIEKISDNKKGHLRRNFKQNDGREEGEMIDENGCMVAWNKCEKSLIYCQECKKEIWILPSQKNRKFCSILCCNKNKEWIENLRIKNLGENNPMYGKRKSRILDGKEEKVIKLYVSEKIDAYKIAKLMKCSTMPIYTILKENHIEIRENTAKFKKGHKTWNKDKTHPNYIKWIENVREIGKLNKGRPSSRRGLSKIEQFGEERAKEINEKNRVAHLGRRASLETRKKLSLIHKGRFISQETRERMSISRKILWSDEGYRKEKIKMIYNSFKFKKTKPERILDRMLKRNNLSFSFVGNGKFLIEGFNPDFVCKDLGLIIEVFGDYWHTKGNIVERDKRRFDAFSKHNFRTLVLWEHEIVKTEFGRRMSEEELLCKIKNFMGDIKNV